MFSNLASFVEQVGLDGDREMKRITPKIILIASCIATCIFISYRSWMRLHAVEQYIAHFDEALSEHVRQEISANLCSQIGNDPDVAIATLLDVFGCIESASIAIEPNKEAIANIVAQKPLVRMNDTVVLTEHSRVISIDSYDPVTIQQLASLHAPQSVLADVHELEIMATQIKSIERDLLNKFEVTWNSHHEVTVRDPREPLITMVCCAYQLADKNKIEAYFEQIHQLVTEKNTSGKPKLFIADIRFENQIVLRSNAMNSMGKVINGTKGGIQHGTSVS